MEKKVLNESELKFLTLELLKEERYVEIEGKTYDIFKEGFWDKLKSGFRNTWDSAKGQLAKLGSITKGGKYFGKEKAQAAADKQMDDEMAKRGKSMIRQLDKTLKTEFPGFPNMKNKEQFLAASSEIQRVYDSIVAATQKQKGSKGYISPRRANNIIKSLRMYVQKLVDYELASVYRMFNENDQSYYNKNKHLLNEAVSAAKGPLTGSKETETEKVYKSNKAPLTLLGIGTALGAFSWLVNTDWFRGLFETKSQVPVTNWVAQDTEKVLGAVQPGDGLTQTMNATLGTNLSAASTPEKFVDGLAKLGNGNPEKGVELLTQKGGLFPDSAGAKAALTDIVKNPHGHGDNLGQIFQGKMAGTGKVIGDVLVTKSGGAIVGAITSMVPNIVMMTAVRTGAGYLAAKGLGGVLGPLGIGLVAAGAAVKALRMKGLKKSRMKTLQSMLMTFDDVAVPKRVSKKKQETEPVEKKGKPEPKGYKVAKGMNEPQTQLNYDYTTPSSAQSGGSYTVPGTTPQFGSPSATTTRTAQNPTKSTSTKGKKAPVPTKTSQKKKIKKTA